MNSGRWLVAVALLAAPFLVFADQSRDLPLERIKKGLMPTNRGPTQFVVARTPDQWRAGWRLLFTDADGYVEQPGLLERETLPTVDLDRLMVLGIVLETHSNGCTGVTIIGASVVDSQVVARYRERKIRTDVIEACTTSFTLGFDFVAVPKSDLPVVFKEEDDVPVRSGR